MKNFIVRYYVLLILIVIFAIPGVTALYFYQNPALLGQMGTNKGQLLQPPYLIEALKQSDKWHLLYSHSGVCEANCAQTLEKLAKIRLALGRKLYHVELNLLENEAHIVSDLDVFLQKADIKKVTNNLPDSLKNPAIFIANPTGNLILSYTPETLPKDIFHDLKLLVSQAEKGSSS